MRSIVFPFNWENRGINITKIKHQYQSFDTDTKTPYLIY